jgi:hypothetical protein
MADCARYRSRSVASWHGRDTHCWTCGHVQYFLPVPTPEDAQKLTKVLTNGLLRPVTSWYVDGLRGGLEPCANGKKKMERKTGFEPATPTLARWCSTAEPLPLSVLTL